MEQVKSVLYEMYNSVSGSCSGLDDVRRNTIVEVMERLGISLPNSNPYSNQTEVLKNIAMQKKVWNNQILDGMAKIN